MGREYLNGGKLWAIVSASTSVAVLATMATVELSRPQDVSNLIQLSVRCSVPWLYLAFAASSSRILFPGALSRWALRNRRVFGLCFAAGMFWQLFFIVWLVAGHWTYYRGEVYAFGDIVFQVPGYVLLTAMTLTSFRGPRRWISSRQWKWLHKVGIYFLWFTVWDTYRYELYYYDDIQLIDYVYFWIGLLAFGTRVLAWGKVRWSSGSRVSNGSRIGAAID